MRNLNEYCVNVHIIATLMVVISVLSGCIRSGNDESASVRRYKTQGMLYEIDNEFWTAFTSSPLKGLDSAEGISRKDPSSVIKVDDTYYVWYTRSSEIWYATSRDGYFWMEQGLVTSLNEESSGQGEVQSSDILIADGKYYLFFGNNLDRAIYMLWAESPKGPWHKHLEPVLKPGFEGDFDEHSVLDPCIMVKGGKYFMYYRGQSMGPDARNSKRAAWGVAIAKNPEDPFIKSKLNPLLFGGDEGILFYSYRDGICAILPQGPERGTVQFSEDGLNFYPKAHGVRDKYYGGMDSYPVSAGGYREDNISDVEEGLGLNWGLYNSTRIIDGRSVVNLARFDCDLSIQRGDSLRRENERWLQKYHRK
ncbi:family 43 glycosylhydrolase [Bacteroidota bacterium]